MLASKQQIQTTTSRANNLLQQNHLKTTQRR